MSQNRNEEHKKEIDTVSGVETTGHEWDGLKELNNPLPRWWVWVFLVCILWSIWYFVVYPAWPVLGTENQGATVGTSGYTQFKELKSSQEEIMARQKAYLSDFQKASFEEIMHNPALYSFAMAGGAAAFKDNCATCHGSGAEGSKGYPNLNDDDWLWGGKIDEIHTTLLHGIRVQGDYDTRLSQMPAFGKDGVLTKEQIHGVVEYVLAMHEGHADVSSTGGVIYREQCASCHGEDGRGDHAFGAPNLRDAIWLYGRSEKEIYHSIYNARAGMMPAWKDRLDQDTIRQLAIYVHQLGGGEVDLPEVIEAVPSEESDDTPVDPVIEELEDERRSTE